MRLASFELLAFHLAVVAGLWTFCFFQVRSARGRGGLNARERTGLTVVFACGLLVLALALVMAVFGH